MFIPPGLLEKLLVVPVGMFLVELVRDAVVVVQGKRLQDGQLDGFVAAAIARDEHTGFGHRPAIGHAADGRVDHGQLRRREVGRVVQGRQTPRTCLHQTAHEGSQGIVCRLVGAIYLRTGRGTK